MRTRKGIGDKDGLRSLYVVEELYGTWFPVFPHGTYKGAVKEKHQQEKEYPQATFRIRLYGRLE